MKSRERARLWVDLAGLFTSVAAIVMILSHNLIIGIGLLVSSILCFIIHLILK